MVINVFCSSFNLRLLVFLIQVPYVKKYIEYVCGYKRKYIYFSELAEIQMYSQILKKFCPWVILVVQRRSG